MKISIYHLNTDITKINIKCDNPKISYLIINGIHYFPNKDSLTVKGD